MPKVTRNQAVVATIFGAGLTLTSLLLKRQAARVTAATAGIILAGGTWYTYKNRGPVRFLDTNAQENLQTLTNKQFKELLKRPEDVERNWILENGTTGQLKSCAEPFSASDYVQLGTREDLQELFTLDELLTLILKSDSKHDALLEIYCKILVERLREDEHPSLNQMQLSKLREKYGAAYITVVLQGLNEEQKKKCVEVLADAIIWSSSYVSDLVEAECAFLKEQKLPETRDLDSMFRSCNEGLTLATRWAVKELFTRERLDLVGSTSLRSLLKLDSENVDPQVIMSHKDQHAQSIEEIKKYTAAPFRNGHFPESCWALTLLPAETVKLIQEFCDQQRTKDLPEDFKPGVTELDLSTFNRLIDYQVFTEDDLLAMVGFKAETLDETHGVMTNQVRWAMEALVKRPDLKIETFLEAMQILVADGGQVGAGRLAAFVVSDFLKRDDVDRKNEQVHKLIKLPFQLKEGNVYAERAFNLEFPEEPLIAGLKAYWEREFVPNPGAYRAYRSWETATMRKLKCVTADQLIAMAGAEFEAESSLESPMCWAVSQLFSLKLATLDDLLAGMKALISVENKVTETCALFAGATIGIYLKCDHDLDLNDEKVQELIFLPFELKQNEGYRAELLTNVGKDKIETVKTLLETKKKEKK